MAKYIKRNMRRLSSVESQYTLVKAAVLVSIKPSIMPYIERLWINLLM
jgi:hypothetical protein